MSRSLGLPGIAALAAAVMLAPAATLASDSRADRPGQRAVKQNKSLSGPRTKGQWTWQPGAYAVNPDLGNATGGPARRFMPKASAVTQNAAKPHRSDKSLTTPAKPSPWAHQYEVKSGKANLYDHTFDTPKKRRAR